MLNITPEVQADIISSIALDNIESFDDEDEPEVYSANININVTIDGETYTVMHQRGTDGEVDVAPFDDSGLPNVYEVLMKLSGEYKEGLCDDSDDVYEMFEGGDDEGLVSEALSTFADAVRSKIARLASNEHSKFDTDREAELVVTDEFGVDGDGHVCDTEAADAVMLFEHSNEKYANLIRFEVSEKNDGGRWSYVRDYDCFHFHLTQEEVFRRYMEEQAIRAEAQEREAVV